MTRCESPPERGAILVAGAIGIIALLAFGALVVDLLRMERIGRSLHRAADAAALAGSLNLKGDPYEPPTDLNATLAGWRSAKRAAILAVRQNLIAEDTGAVAGAAAWGQDGLEDPWESTARYRNTIITVGKIRVTIERGAWLYLEGTDAEHDADASHPSPYFESLESSDGRCPGATTCSPKVNHPYANGVKVKIELLDMRTFFPLGSAGRLTWDSISREAIASTAP